MPSPNHVKFDDNLLDQIRYLLKHQALLMPLEKSIIIDRMGKFKEFRYNAVISLKQRELIETTYWNIQLILGVDKMREKDETNNTSTADSNI